MNYSKEERQEITDEIVGKTIKSLEWDEEGKYWTMVISEDVEITFRLMAEIHEITPEKLKGLP
jgi:hypothetical protein